MPLERNYIVVYLTDMEALPEEVLAELLALADETSLGTVRKSKDGVRCALKWNEGQCPSCQVGLPHRGGHFTQEEILDELERADLDHRRCGTKNYCVQQYDSKNRLKSEEWYDHFEDGEYEGLVEKITYSYVGNRVMYQTVKQYALDGAKLSSIKYRYYTKGKIRSKRRDDDDDDD